MFKPIHRIHGDAPFHTNTFDVGVRAPGNPQPVQVAMVGAGMKLLRHATSTVQRRKPVPANKVPIAQPVELTIGGAPRSIKTLEEAQSAAYQLGLQSKNLQSQRATYKRMAQVYSEKLSNPGANAEHLRAQIQTYKNLATEQQRAHQLLDAQIQLLRDTFKF